MNNLAFFVIAMNFLLGVSDQLTEQLRADLSPTNGVAKVIFQNQVLEVKKEVTGNSFELLDTSSRNIKGLSSFDDDGIEVGRAFVFGQVSICYATGTTTGKVREMDYNTKAPKELLNAVVTITQAGRTVLELPFRDFHNINSTYSTNSKDEYTDLLAICHFNDGKKIKITVTLPEGVALDSTTNKHYLWFRAKGLQTAKKPNA